MGNQEIVPKKLPLRKCCACNQMKPKKELVRLVKTPESNIELDFTGKKNGRGVYVCSNTECFEKAKKARRFERALSSQIAQEIYDKMQEEIAKQEVSND